MDAGDRKGRGLYRGRLLWYDAGAYPQDDGYLQKYGRTEADREGGDGGFFLWTGRDFGVTVR